MRQSLLGPGQTSGKLISKGEKAKILKNEFLIAYSIQFQNICVFFKSVRWANHKFKVGQQRNEINNYYVVVFLTHQGYVVNNKYDTGSDHSK